MVPQFHISAKHKTWLPFQVGYREAGQEYTLYLVAAKEQDRAEWIRAIRAVCSENPGLSGRYHAGFWSGKRWSCCRMSTRSAEGCDTCSSWSTSSKSPSIAATPSITSANGSERQQQTSSNVTSGTTTTTTICSETNNNPIVQSQTRSNNGVPLAGTSNSRQKPHYPEEQCNPVSQEGFKRKKKKAKGPGYSQGFRIRKQAEDTSDSDEADIEDEKSQAKTKEPKPALRSRHSAKNTKKDEVPKIKTEKVDDSEKLEGRKTKAHQHAETELTVQEESIYSCGGSSDSSDDLTSILHRKMEENRDIPSRVDSSVGSKNCSIDPNERHRELYEDLPKYINGLVTDPTFYSSSRSRMVNVARYSSHNSAVNNEFSVSARDFSKLMSKNGWLSGDVIDYALANIADQCDDVTHIGTIDSHRIVGEGSDGRHRFPTRWKLLSLKNVKDRIIMGYTFNLHWRLIYINIPAKKFYLLDPYKDGSDEERACRKFKEFLAKCHVDSSFHELAQVDWTFDKMEDLRAYQDPLDSSSCGIFLTCYAEDLALKKALRRQFDIEASRRELGDRILSASENLSERCIHCGLLVDKKGVVCIICHGISHCHCICESHMDSDLEGPDIPCKASYQDAKMYREAKKKIAANLDLSQPFICKLCKRYFEI
ncbi:hypothetical protein QAD02_012161 [Eretmocerus hayati]|uniref:Uncharacterized protein n=1 Tax=Eretmocerus hayati TaxID=131215 RepID=A0ACC2NYP4_9HYME|nr:hypothetical protein QAD02_012161 [Eretmocerus hayati]